jgi:hypothetical protein
MIEVRMKFAITFVLGSLLVSNLFGAVPQVRAVGALAQGTGAISPGIPSGTLQDDILLLFVETADEFFTVTGGTETWTQVADSPQRVTPDTMLSVYWARSSQDTPTGPSVSDSGNHTIGRMIAFSGAITTGNPWEVTSGGTEAVSDTTGSITGDTTTIDDCMIVAAMATDLPDQNDTTSFSGVANGDLASVTERIDNCRNAGNGGCIFAATGELATAGTYGATTVTLEDAAQKAFMTIALKPPAASTRRVIRID